MKKNCNYKSEKKIEHQLKSVINNKYTIKYDISKLLKTPLNLTDSNTDSMQIRNKELELKQNYLCVACFNCSHRNSQKLPPPPPSQKITLRCCTNHLPTCQIWIHHETFEQTIIMTKRLASDFFGTLFLL